MIDLACHWEDIPAIAITRKIDTVSRIHALVRSDFYHRSEDASHGTSWPSLETSIDVKDLTAPTEHHVRAGRHAFRPDCGSELREGDGGR